MDLLDILTRMAMGALFAITAVLVYVKHRSILGMLFWLSWSAAFIGLGLLRFYGLMEPKWVNVSTNAVVGMSLTIAGIAGLCSPPSASYPRWTQWASLIIGLGFLLSAIIVGLTYF